MPIINKDGKANKVYVRKMWNHVMETSVDAMNGELSDEEFKGRVHSFRDMANKLTKQTKDED